MPQISSPRESLASILTVERVRDGEFITQLESFWGDSLPGDVLARAALAAADSCKGQDLHSLHACYLKPAPAGVPLTLMVERLDDGPGLARRQVRVVGEKLLCHVVASFASPTDGLAYQHVAFEPGFAAPETLRSTLEQARAEGWPEDYARGPVEFRRVRPSSWPDAPEGEPVAHVDWVKPREPLLDDPRLHMAALVFLADFYSHWEFERRVGRKFAYDRFRPLDLALWVHRQPRWNGWWLMEATTDVAHAGRALSRREIYARDGVLLASAVREASIASV